MSTHAFLKAWEYPSGVDCLEGGCSTVSCSALRKEDGSYAPAHLLYDIRMERAGRSCTTAEQPSTRRGIALTAALVIIGDELLSGKVDDINTPFLCRELHAIGWQIAKVCIA